MEIIESIYAYLYNNNYEGATEIMEGLYTLTGCDGQAALDMLKANREHGNAGLEQIDGDCGVLYDGATPDFGLAAYSCMTCSDGRIVVSRAGLRAALKDKTGLRGHKELIHAVLLDVPQNDYAVDYTYSAVFESFTDIPLDESKTDGNGVFELPPSRLAALANTAFSSAPLKLNELEKLGMRGVAVIADAIMFAKKENRSLYIVYDMQSMELVRDYIRAALKLLPPRLANSISFITACDGNDHIKRDICGVPTIDERVIERIKANGITVSASASEVKPLTDIPVDKFLKLFAGKRSDAKSAFETLGKCFKYIHTFEEFETVFAFICGRLGGEGVKEMTALALRGDKDFGFIASEILCSDSAVDGVCCALDEAGCFAEFIRYVCVCDELLGGPTKKALDRAVRSLIPELDKKTFDELYSRYEMLKTMTVGAKAHVVELDKIFAEYIIQPHYKTVISAISPESFSAADKSHAQELIKAFGAEEKAFASELTAALKHCENADGIRRTEKRLTDLRVRFVLRELSLLDGKTAYRLLKNYLPKAVTDKAYDDHGLERSKPYGKFGADKFASAVEQAATEFLTGDSDKTEFCEAVKRERDKKNVDFRIKLADASRNVLESVVLSVMLFIVVAAVSAVLYVYYGGAYFVSVYVAFPFISAAVGQILYWYNVGANKMYTPFKIAAWQSATVCAAMLVCYFVVHAVLSAVLG